MTFEEWYDKFPLWDLRLPVIETWLAQCWKDSANAQRELDAEICEKWAQTVRQEAHTKISTTAAGLLYEGANVADEMASLIRK